MVEIDNPTHRFSCLQDSRTWMDEIINKVWYLKLIWITLVYCPILQPSVMCLIISALQKNKQTNKQKKERKRRKKSHPGNELFMTDIKFKTGKEDSHLCSFCWGHPFLLFENNFHEVKTDLRKPLTNSCKDPFFGLQFGQKYGNSLALYFWYSSLSMLSQLAWIHFSQERHCTMATSVNCLYALPHRGQNRPLLRCW